jgi:protein-S-isoprenylcysteine O-methyltransferase Ste14
MPASLRPTSRRWVVYGFAALLLWAAAPTEKGLAAGAVLVAAGFGVRIWATGHLRKNHALATQGPYAFVRHPLYAGTLLCMLGFVAASSGDSRANHFVLVGLLAAGLAGFFLYYLPYKSRVEADRLVRRFGDRAERYLRAVPNLLPVRAPFRGEPGRWSLRQVLRNREHWTCAAGAAALAVLWLKASATP